MIKNIKHNLLTKLLVFILIFATGLTSGWYLSKHPIQTQSVSYQQNSPQAFYSEVYDKIKENYWESVTDETLIQAFKDASSALGKPISQNIYNREDLIKQLDSKDSARLVTQVLTSLKPLGRSGLFTTKQQEELKNTVENRNPKSGQIEPTIFAKALPNTLYLQFIKFSPTSLEEIQQAFKTNENEQQDSLILDLRGNVGGAIDATAYFIGFFIGKNQLAFDFYRKGDFLPFRTPTDMLPTVGKYRNIVVLIDNQTQSSAELLAASFKKYNLGKVVGSPTKGWGTVEKVFSLENQVKNDETYSMFLVHSITLRDDNQPIEGRGVEPDIKLSDPGWEKDFNQYFRNSSLLNVLKGVI